MEVGDFFDFWKGGDLGKWDVDLEKGGMNPITDYDFYQNSL